MSSFPLRKLSLVKVPKGPVISDTPTPLVRNPIAQQGAVGLLPAPDDRAGFLGTTGSGKTTAAVYLMRAVVGRVQIRILDAKGEDALELPGAVVCTHLADCARAARNAPVLVYRPVADELGDPLILDAWCQWSYDVGEGLTYIDEVTAVARGVNPPPGVLNLLSRGRRRVVNGVEVHSPLWWASQRPRRIPLSFYTETQCIYCFFLRHEDDRAAVAKFTTPTFALPPSQRYGFRFVRDTFTSGLEFGPFPIRQKRSSR